MPEIDTSFEYINPDGYTLEGMEPKREKRTYQELAAEITTRFLREKDFDEARLQAALMEAARQCCEEDECD